MAFTNNTTAVSSLSTAKKTNRSVTFSGISPTEPGDSAKSQGLQSRCMTDLNKCETFNTISSAMLNRSSFQATLLAWRRREQAFRDHLTSYSISSTHRPVLGSINEANGPESLPSGSPSDLSDSCSDSPSSRITVKENKNYSPKIVEPDRPDQTTKPMNRGPDRQTEKSQSNQSPMTAAKCETLQHLNSNVAPEPDGRASPNVRPTSHPLSSPPPTSMPDSTSSACMPEVAQGTSLSSTVINVATKNIASTAVQQSEKQPSPVRAQNDKREKSNASACGAKSGPAKIMLCCVPNSHPFNTRTILLKTNIECKVGRNVGKRKATESNAIFDCKVLSLDHAVLWYSKEGKFWIRDTKSSNGTFINERKLGAEAEELHSGDIVRFGAAVIKRSLKRMHVGIIARIMLYQPDGDETNSDNARSRCSLVSKEDVISYKDLDCLSINEQEASKPGKPVKSKIFIINNLLDAPSKGSTTSMMLPSIQVEDQQMHDMPIHSLERNLQLVDESAPESTLSKEILQLLDDQDKEALLKVCQEHCDAVHPTAKDNSLQANPDEECEFLLDQMITSMQCMQEVSERLSRIEAEYNQYKEDAQRQLLKTKQLAEEREALFLEQLQQSNMAYEALREKLGELRPDATSVAESSGEEFEQLEKQALKYLDAVIGDVDSRDEGETTTESCVCTQKTTQPKIVQDTTIVRWLQNLELSEEGGPLTTDSAICNYTDSCDERESVLSVGESICRSSCNFSMKLTKVPRILQHLERDMSSTLKALKTKSAGTENNIENLNDLNYKNFLLLSHCVAVVQEAYDDFCFRTKQKALKQRKSETSTIQNAASNMNFSLHAGDEGDEGNDVEDDDAASDNSSRLTIETVLSAFRYAAEENDDYQQIQPADQESKRMENVRGGKGELSEDLLRSKNQLQIMCERIRNQQEANGKKLCELNVTLGNLRSANQALVKVVNANISNGKDTADAHSGTGTVVELDGGAGIAPCPTSTSDANSLSALKAEQPKPITENTDIAISTYLAKCDELEQKIQGDLATVKEFVLSHEKNVVVYRQPLQRSPNTDNGALQLWRRFAELEKRIPCKLSWLFMRFVLPFGAVLFLVLIIFVVLVKS